MLKQSYLLVSGNGRISPYTTRRNTIVILSQVLRENTAIYGHGGRIWQYTVVNESGHSTWAVPSSPMLMSLEGRKSRYAEERVQLLDMDEDATGISTFARTG